MSGLHPYFFFPSLSHFTLAQEKEGEKDLNTQARSFFLSRLPLVVRGKKGKTRGKKERSSAFCVGRPAENARVIWKFALEKYKGELGAIGRNIF